MTKKLVGDAGMRSRLRLVTVIAPDFVTGRPADMVALAITVAVTRLSILPTVVIAMASAAVLRSLLG